MIVKRESGKHENSAIQGPKILFATHVGSQGGAEAKMRSLCKGLSQAQVLTFEQGALVETLQADGIPVQVSEMPDSIANIRKEDGLLKLLGAIPSLFSMILKTIRISKAFDVLVPMSQKAFVVFALVKLVKRKPLIWYMNDMLTEEHFSNSLIRVMVLMGRMSADHIVFNSQASLNSWLKFGGKVDKASVSYSGVELDTFENPGPLARKGLKASYFDNQAPIVTVVGRITPWKGQFVFLQALLQMPNVNGLIVGAPMFGEESFQQELETFVAEHGLGQRVCFTGHRDDVPELLAISDIVVHCSTTPEPFGRVIVEAMLAGKPVIASDAGGPQEIIQHGKTGLLIEPGEPHVLVEAVQTLLKQPAVAAEMATAAQKYAHDMFSSQQLLVDFKKIIAKFA